MQLHGNNSVEDHLQTQQVPYPPAQGPPGIPLRSVHSPGGRQLPASPEGATHVPVPH